MTKFTICEVNDARNSFRTCDCGFRCKDVTLRDSRQLLLFILQGVAVQTCCNFLMTLNLEIRKIYGNVAHDLSIGSTMRHTILRMSQASVRKCETGVRHCTLCACVRACVCGLVCVCTGAWVCVRVCVRLRARVCMPVRVCVYMCVCRVCEGREIKRREGGKRKKRKRRKERKMRRKNNEKHYSLNTIIENKEEHSIEFTTDERLARSSYGN